MSLLLRLLRARGEVALLEQAGAEAAGHRVEGRAGADDPAADDQHVELAGDHRVERRGAVVGTELVGHGASLAGAGRAGQPPTTTSTRWNSLRSV